MNTHQDHNIGLPLKGNIALIYVFSFLVAFLMTIASVAGLLYRADIYPTEELIQSFVPNDVVNLLIGVPILLGSMSLTQRRKLIGLLCWAGALFFVFYNYVAYVFAMPLNWVFVLHLALMALSLYALIGLISRIDGKTAQQGLTGAVHEKLAGGILTGLGLLFLLRAIGVMVNALSSGVMLPKTELAVNISDFLMTPVWIIGGIMLWRRQEFGYVAGLGLLFQGSMLFIALIIFLVLQPTLTAASFAVADVLVVFAVGLLCFIPFALFARGVITTSKKQKP